MYARKSLSQQLISTNEGRRGRRGSRLDTLNSEQLKCIIESSLVERRWTTLGHPWTPREKLPLQQHTPQDVYSSNQRPGSGGSGKFLPLQRYIEPVHHKPIVGHVQGFRWYGMGMHNIRVNSDHFPRHAPPDWMEGEEEEDDDDRRNNIDLFVIYLYFFYYLFILNHQTMRRQSTTTIALSSIGYLKWWCYTYRVRAIKYSW